MRMLSKTVKISAIIALSTFLFACVTTGDQKADNEARTTAGGIGWGALIGGALGALASGGDKDKMAKYAALGAGIGAAIGGVVGSEVAKRKNAYASQEALLDGETARTAEFVAEVSNTNKSLRQDVANYKREVDSLNEKISMGYASSNDLQAHLTKVQTRQKQASTALEGVNKELKVARAMYADAKTGKTRSATATKKLAKFESGIAALEREKKELEKYERELLAIGSAISY